MGKNNTYKSLFEEANESRFIIELKSLSLIDINRQARKLLGITKSKTKKYCLPDFFPEDKRKVSVTRFNKIKWRKTGILEDIEIQNLKGGGENVEIETAKIKVEDKILVECKVNAHNNNSLVIKHNEVKFKTLFESANDAILLLNNDTLIDCNEKTLEIFACSRNEILNQKLYKFSPLNQPDGNNSKEIFREKIKAALDDFPQFFEWRHKKADGALFDTEVSLNRIVLENHVMLQAIIRDITDKKLKESTIREQNRRINTLMSNLPGMAYRCKLNRKWTMEFVSEGCLSLTGYKPEDFINDNTIAYNNIIHPEDRDRVWIEINYATERKRPFTILYRIYTRDGFEKWLWEKGIGIFNDSGEIIGLEGFISDITDRKLSEEKISMLAHALKSISECVWIMDMNEVIMFVNNSFCKTYGYEQDEIIGKKISVIRSPNNSMQLINKVRSFTLEDGWSGELLDIKKSGQEFPVLLSTSIIKDDSEKSIALIGITNDITERKRAEEALRQSEERFKSLVDNMLEPAIILSMDGSILFANNSAADLVEIHSPVEASGKDIFEFLHPDFNLKLKRSFIKAKKNPDLFSAEFKIVTSKNNEKWIEGLGKEIIFDGRKAVLITLHDISGRKKAEEQLKEAKEYAEEMNKLKSAFLANMSHELRTPLVGILGYSEMLLEKLEDPDQVDMVDKILFSGNRLMETLNSVLDLSRIEANRIDIYLEPINVPAVVKRHTDMFKPTAEKRGLYLRKLFSDENIKALLDERFLGQIINNLVSNSIKFTKKGGITVRVDTIQDKMEKLVQISVSDTGIGIPQKNLDTIFEEFRQVSEGINRHFEGTGLGLTITKRFVKLMEGEISVNSKVGTGSEFVVTFAALDESTDKMKPKEEDISRPLASQSDFLQLPAARQVLFVEDDQSSKDVTQLFLEGICDLTFAKTGEEALEIVKQKKFDAILMDINLGSGISGVETTKLIRKMKEYKNIPIVAITAFAMQGDKDKFLSCGCSHYLSKPYDRNSISKLMKDIFEGQLSRHKI